MKQQISGTVIGSECAPTYACICMDKVEGKSLDYKPFTLLQYIDNIFFIWTHAENKLKTFLENYNQFHPNIKLTRKSSAESISFSDVSGKLS